MKFKNIFVLNTGRCGSYSLYRACSQISNYSTTHESNWGKTLPERLVYPENHIEIDNRLSFYLGDLFKIYGNDAFYVHLVRDEELVAESYFRRLVDQNSICHSWARSITRSKKLNIDDCRDYVKASNSNISHFMDSTKHSAKVDISSSDSMQIFLENIDACIDIPKFISTLSEKSNQSRLNEVQYEDEPAENQSFLRLFDLQYQERMLLKKENLKLENEIVRKNRAIENQKRKEDRLAATLEKTKIQLRSAEKDMIQPIKILIKRALLKS